MNDLKTWLCHANRHNECPGSWNTRTDSGSCTCECHREHAAQAPEIVRSLRRIGVRPATLADLTRFEQRMAAYAEESTR